MRISTPSIPVLLFFFLLLLLRPPLTTQTYNSQFFLYPTSLLTLTTLPNGTQQYQYPDGTPINLGASSSTNPFSDPLALAEGYTVHLHSYYSLTAYIPILFTSAIFESFYRTIFEHAAAELWGGSGAGGRSSSARDSKRVSIAVGRLQLVFRSEPGPVPWHIVAAFAWSMWQAAKRGFTGGYELEIRGPGGGEVTGVVLVVGEDAGGDGVRWGDGDGGTEDCDCSMTEASEMTTEENLDEYIDDFCKRRCRRDNKRDWGG